MSLRFRYSDPRGIDEPAAFVTLGSNIRFGEGGFALSAELAEAAVSGVTIEDPGGLYDFQGLRAFEVAETSAASNNQIIGRFVMADQTISRGRDKALLTGADRLWSIDLADYNWHAGKRVLVDQDSNRPEETAGDRLRWLLNDAAHVNLNDYGNVTYPTQNLDAADFRLQRPLDVLADCAVEGGYLFWVDYNEAHGKPELFFIDPDSTNYQATIAASNLVEDVDNAEVFYPYRDAQLVRTPRPIAFGVAVPYENGFVYVRNDTVGQQFAKQDQVAPMANVKKAARARRIANRFLNQYDEQSERIHFSFKVPWAQVNDVRHGHLMNVKFQHLPGYTDWTGVRVLRKFVTLDPEGGADYALLSLEAVPVGVTSSTPSTSPAVLWVWYNQLGDVFTGTLTIQASDDGAAWTTIVDNATLQAGTTNPPGYTGTVQGLVSVGTLRYRYWRIHNVVNHGGGYFGGLRIDQFALLSGDGWDAVDRLGMPREGFPTLWWEAEVGGVGTVAWDAASSGPYLAGSVSTDTGTIGVDITGLAAGVYGAVTITSTWTWDIGA